MEVLSVEELRRVCPVKWHNRIPEDGISLGVADVDFHGPQGILEFIKSNLKEEFSFYQHQQGLAGAIIAATDYLRNRGCSQSENRIQVIEGTMMGISIAMQWIGQKPGDLLVLGPIYEPIHTHASRHRNTLHWSSIDSDGINQEQIKEIITAKDIKMLTICNPTNPIGHVYTKDELGFVSDMCQDNDLYLFSDELYAPLVFDSAFTPAASIEGLENRTIALYGFSKAYGLAGYRSGFMYLGPEKDNIMQLASQYMVSPSPIASLVCEFALTHNNARNWVNDLRQQCQATTKFASSFLRDNNIPTASPDGCFFVFPDIGVEDIEFTEYLMKSKGVQVVPGSAFGPSGKGHLRINCATSIDRLDDGLSRIKDALAQFYKMKE